MFGSSSSASGDRGASIEGVTSMNAARCIARERQKKELRRERDALLVRLARDLGEQGLAESFGVARPVIGKLLADTRARLDAGDAQQDMGEIVVRRISADRDRWAEADAHYEALGSGPTITARQRVVTGAESRPDGERR
jgi:hypothetical protein